MIRLECIVSRGGESATRVCIYEIFGLGCDLCMAKYRMRLGLSCVELKTTRRWKLAWKHERRSATDIGRIRGWRC